jgi:hypothetical protein
MSNWTTALLGHSKTNLTPTLGGQTAIAHTYHHAGLKLAGGCGARNGSRLADFILLLD